MMSQALRKLTGGVSRSKSVLIFINQIREKIGVMFGNPETTTGGRALKFYSSVRVDIRRIAAVKEGDTVTGSRTKVKIVKNKVAAPFREAEFDILYGEGISREGDVLDLAVTHNIVEKSGAWYSYAGERIGQGRENAKAFLKTSPEMADRIERAIRENAGLIAERNARQRALHGLQQIRRLRVIEIGGGEDLDVGGDLVAINRSRLRGCCGLGSSCRTSSTRRGRRGPAWGRDRRGGDDLDFGKCHPARL